MSVNIGTVSQKLKNFKFKKEKMNKNLGKR